MTSYRVTARWMGNEKRQIFACAVQYDSLQFLLTDDWNSAPNTRSLDCGHAHIQSHSEFAPSFPFCIFFRSNSMLSIARLSSFSGGSSLEKFFISFFFSSPSFFLPIFFFVPPPPCITTVHFHNLCLISCNVS